MDQGKAQGGDVTTRSVPPWGRVIPAEGVVPFQVVDADGGLVTPIAAYLREFVARGNRRGSVRAYAFGLQVRLIEEPYLISIHGETYRRYAARVGRFLPALGRLRRS